MLNRKDVDFVIRPAFCVLGRSIPLVSIAFFIRLHYVLINVLNVLNLFDYITLIAELEAWRQLLLGAIDGATILSIEAHRRRHLVLQLSVRDQSPRSSHPHRASRTLLDTVATIHSHHLLDQTLRPCSCHGRGQMLADRVTKPQTPLRLNS